MKYIRQLFITTFLIAAGLQHTDSRKHIINLS